VACTFRLYGSGDPANVALGAAVNSLATATRSCRATSSLSARRFLSVIAGSLSRRAWCSRQTALRGSNLGCKGHFSQMGGQPVLASQPCTPVKMIDQSPDRYAAPTTIIATPPAI
jgi:hypothetical protein